MFGLALYIGEGDKTTNVASITNGDPRVIAASACFFLLLGQTRERFRVRVDLHEGRDWAPVKEFWRGLLRVENAQINAPVWKKSGGKNKNKLNYGICRLSVSDVRLKRQINRWMELALAG